MIDFYYIIHYVVYRFYRRHKEGYSMSMLYACGLQFDFVICSNRRY
jgi:hypothetical protein